MTIKNGETPDLSRMNLDQTLGTRGVSPAPAGGSGGTSRTSANDSISLSTPSSYLQQALTAGSAQRAARIQQLKNQIDANQYQVDAQTVSRAVIDAHLAGG